MSNVILKGDKELERKLKKLIGPELARVVKGAARAAMQPVQREAKRNAKRALKGTGFYAKSITTKVKSYQQGSVVVAMVGPQANTVDPATGEKPAKIAHLLEFGTKPHAIRPKKAKLLASTDQRSSEAVVFGTAIIHPGTRGHRIFEKAMDAKRQQAARNYQSGLKRFIEKEAAKGGFRI